MALNPPYVQFKQEINGNLNNDLNVILDNPDLTSIVDCIVYTNKTTEDMVVTTYIRRNNEDTERHFVKISGLSSVDILINEEIMLEAGDAIVASSDSSSSIFNAFVAYRRLIETTETGED